MPEKSKIRPFLFKRTKKDGRRYYSVINKYLKEGKIDPKFVEMLSGLSLEDVIALKLEQANRMVAGRLYSIPIMKFVTRICKDAVLKYAISASRTYPEAASFLGVTEGKFAEYRKQYKTDLFFGENDEKSTTSQ